MKRKRVDLTYDANRTIEMVDMMIEYLEHWRAYCVECSSPERDIQALLDEMEFLETGSQTHPQVILNALGTVKGFHTCMLIKLVTRGNPAIKFEDFKDDPEV